MEKEEVKFEQLKDDLLSPGNIYWRKSSGAEVLISGKSDILNLKMLEKLSQSNNLILIEDSIDYEAQDQLIEAFKKYKAEILIPQKIEWRTLFNSLLLKYYYNSTKSQFELNQLFWKLFSTIPREQGEQFMNRDRDYFLRAGNVATSYTLCAFLMGYYSEDFLAHIYNSTILNQMDVGKNELINSLKLNLEKIRQKASLSEEDREYISSIIDTDNFEQNILFEKYDGSGLLNINIHELSDLELMFTSLNCYYHFNDKDHQNILLDINERRFNTSKKIMNVLLRNFELIKESLAKAS